MSPNGQSGALVLSGQGSSYDTNGHGRFQASPLVTGSLVGGGSLTVVSIDADYGGSNGATLAIENSLVKYNVSTLNAAPVATKLSSLASPYVNYVANILTDVARGPDGKYYVMEDRSAGVEPGLYVLDASGNILTDSRSLTRALAKASGTPNDALFYSPRRGRQPRRQDHRFYYGCQLHPGCPAHRRDS